MMLSLSRFPQCTLLNRTTDLSLRCLICWLITIQLHTSKAFNTKNTETLSTLKVTWRFWGVGTLQSVWALLCFTSTCVYFNFSAWLSCLPYLPHKWSCDFMVLAKQWSHATGTDNYSSSAVECSFSCCLVWLHSSLCLDVGNIVKSFWITFSIIFCLYSSLYRYAYLWASISVSDIYIYEWGRDYIWDLLLTRNTLWLFNIAKQKGTL